MTQDKVAIILINWNSYPYTNQCISSIKLDAYPQYDIIVVDNNSQDGSGKKLKLSHPEIILLESEINLGFAGGNNLAMRYALENDYPYILLLNNDTIVSTNFLAPLVKFIQDNPGTGAIQPKIYFNHDRTLLWNGGSSYNRWIGFTYSARFNKTSDASTESTRQVDWISGCCLLTTTNVIRQVGEFDENFFMYYEDVDLSFRMKKAGYQLVYHPKSIIYHIAGGSGKSKEKGKEGYVHPAIYFYSLRNKIWVLKKYVRFYEWPGVLIANTIYYSGVVCYFLLRWRFIKLKATIKAIFAGINGRMGLYSQ